LASGPNELRINPSSRSFWRSDEQRLLLAGELTHFADSPRARGTHTLFRNLIRLDDFRLEGLRHARFNQRFS